MAPFYSLTLAPFLRLITKSYCALTRKVRCRLWTALNHCCLWSRGVRNVHTHDYARHGTTSLFAALNVATGHVIGRYHQRHRQQEFLKFLDLIDQTIPAEPGVEIHLVMDNDATYKQSPACQTLVRQAASRPGAFLAHQYFVTQPSRTILCGNYRETDPPQRVPQRRGTQESHPRRLGSPQLKLQAISMDR